MIELLSKIVDVFEPLTTFAKSSWQSPKYVLFFFPLIVSIVNFDIALRSLSAANLEPLQTHYL